MAMLLEKTWDENRRWDCGYSDIWEEAKIADFKFQDDFCMISPGIGEFMRCMGGRVDERMRKGII